MVSIALELTSHPFCISPQSFTISSHVVSFGFSFHRFLKSCFLFCKLLDQDWHFGHAAMVTLHPMANHPPIFVSHCYMVRQRPICLSLVSTSQATKALKSFPHSMESWTSPFCLSGNSILTWSNVIPHSLSCSLTATWVAQLKVYLMIGSHFSETSVAAGCCDWGYAECATCTPFCFPLDGTRSQTTRHSSLEETRSVAVMRKSESALIGSDTYYSLCTTSFRPYRVASWSFLACPTVTLLFVEDSCSWFSA